MKDKDNNTSAFITYLNYLISLSNYLKTNKNFKNELIEIISCNEFQSFFNKKNELTQDKINKISKFLRNSWLTERQMHQNEEDTIYIKIANHWICIKAYYSIYLTLRALFIAKNINISETHTASLKEINNLIKNQPKIFPIPWKILCNNPEDSSSNHTRYEYINLPSNTEINHNNSSLKKNKNFYDAFTRLLKTTRNNLLEEKYFEHRKQNKVKKISITDKKKIAEKFYPTSFFNFINRLRNRSNYKDADMFLLSEISESDTKKFYQSILTITDFTLLLLEVFLYRCISKKNYEQILEKFTEYLPNGECSCKKRFQFIEELFDSK